jgi:hypothetical protein
MAGQTIFGSDGAIYFREQVLRPFLAQYLKDCARQSSAAFLRQRNVKPLELLHPKSGSSFFEGSKASGLQGWKPSLEGQMIFWCRGFRELPVYSPWRILKGDLSS